MTPTPPPRDADSVMVPPMDALLDSLERAEIKLLRAGSSLYVSEALHFVQAAINEARALATPPAPDALRLAREAVPCMFLPCPFCGSAAREAPAHGGELQKLRPAFDIECSNEACDVQPSARTADAWNRRALPSGAAVQGEAAPIGYVKPKSLEWLRQNPQGCIQLFGLPIKDNGDCPVYATPLAKSDGRGAVDDAMVERAANAYDESVRAASVPLSVRPHRTAIRAALTAALGASHDR